MRTALVLVTVGLSAACATAAVDPSSSECVSGSIQLTGLGPTGVVLLSAADRRFVVEGVVEPEVRAFQGGSAEVCGEVRGEAPAHRLLATSYRVELMNGAPAWDGRLEWEGGELHLVSSTGRWILAHPPEDLVRQAGRRVWVSGEESADTIRVHSYGWIR